MNHNRPDHILKSHEFTYRRPKPPRRPLIGAAYRYGLVVRCAKNCSQFLSQIGTLFESTEFCETVTLQLSIFFSFSEGLERNPLNCSSQSPTTNRASPPISHPLTSSFGFTSTLQAQVIFPIQLLPLFPFIGPGFSALRDIEHVTAAIQKARDLRGAHNLGWITSLA
jgi:hypothetical protein